MRIARVLTRLNLGGPARQVLASDPILGRRGHTVRVFAGRPEPGEGDLFEAARIAGIDVVRVSGLKRGLSPFRDLLARRELSRALREFAPDLLHTHASKAGTLGRLAVRANPELGRVHTFHGHVLEGYFPEPVSRRLIAHETRLARETDRIAAVSHATADDLVRLGVCAEEQLVVIPPGIDLEPLLAIERGARRNPGPLRELIGAGSEELLIGVIGRLAQVKRVELALEVFAGLATRHPRAQLCLVGDGGERRSLERRIGALEPETRRRTHLVGARDDMPAVLADLDVVLLTSRSEGLPVSLIEAGAAGLPVVATPVGGVPELVIHERTGLLGPGPDELAVHLHALLSEEALRREIGQRARLRVRERHGAERLADRLEELYTLVAQERACVS